MDKIASFNSSELLNYSKALRQLREEIGVAVSNYLFKAIHERTEVINNSPEAKKISDESKAVKIFLKKKTA